MDNKEEPKIKIETIFEAKKITQQIFPVFDNQNDKKNFDNENENDQCMLMHHHKMKLNLLDQHSGQIRPAKALWRKRIKHLHLGRKITTSGSNYLAKRSFAF